MLGSISRFLHFTESDKYHTLCLLICYVVSASPFNPHKSHAVLWQYDVCSVWEHCLQEAVPTNAPFVFVPSWTMQLVLFSSKCRKVVWKQFLSVFTSGAYSTNLKTVSDHYHVRSICKSFDTSPLAGTSLKSTEDAAGLRFSWDGVSFPEFLPHLLIVTTIAIEHHGWYECHWMTNQYANWTV